MVLLERRSCAFCRAWLRDVGPVWDRSSLGRQAPLRRVDLDHPLPPDLGWIELGAGATPTFLLARGGRELGRLVGYRNAELFWIGATTLLQALGEPPA